MSGRDEQPQVEIELKCNNCEGTKFDFITHGYSIDSVDIATKDFDSSGFEGTDSEDWCCNACGREASDEIKEYLFDEDWYNW